MKIRPMPRLWSLLPITTSCSRRSLSRSLNREHPFGTKVKSVCNSGTVNIRVGNGTDYGRITAVADGTVFEHVATAANGWHAVKVGSQIGWVSGKYSEITTA